MDAVTVFAHPGHWAASLAYMMPVVVLMGFFGVQKLRDRRQTRAGNGARPEPTDPGQA